MKKEPCPKCNDTGEYQKTFPFSTGDLIETFPCECKDITINKGTSVGRSGL